jgi:voltage-gated potassium channel
MVAFLIIFIALGRLYREMAKQPETRGLLVSAIAVLFIGVLFYTSVEHWTILNAIYFCVVTLGTVGYGDITPTTDIGKIFTIFYIIVGLGIIGGFFAVAGRMFQAAAPLRKEKNRLEDKLHPDDESPTQVENNK